MSMLKTNTAGLDCGSNITVASYSTVLCESVAD